MVSAPSIRREATAGFTLVELLAVMSVMAILLVISVPAFVAIKGDYNLDATRQAVVDQLNLARQHALASSHPVNVRFYLIPDYNNNTAGSVFNGKTSTVYRAMQCFLEGDPTISSGTNVTPVTAISKPLYFSAPVIFVSPNTITSSNTDVSNLLNSAYSGITYVSAGDVSNPLAPPYGAASYSYFRFRGNGQTDLTSLSLSSSLSDQITLVLETSAGKATTSTLPPNYVTLQLNTVSGMVTTYRP